MVGCGNRVRERKGGIGDGEGRQGKVRRGFDGSVEREGNREVGRRGERES